MNQHAPLGAHFNQVDVDALIEKMREAIDAAATIDNGPERRASHELIIAYMRFLPAELNRGTSPQAMGEATVRALAWIAAQLVIGAPTQHEQLEALNSVGLNIMMLAVEHLQGRPVGVVMPEAGGHG